MITNNVYIDGITHRQMRKFIIEDFDKIYVFDLHGGSKELEKSPDPSRDENIFDIKKVDVGVLLLMKLNNAKSISKQILHSEIHGNREKKYNILSHAKIENMNWSMLHVFQPYYSSIPKISQG